MVKENDKNIEDDIIMREITKKNNSHEHDIVVIQTSKNGLIITGSNDGTIKLWK